ncbi:hypothetical protein HL666_14795 [Bradyrhizobium sp. 83002]|uniref:hypothetical protein n=1 Tax=Bradyrhizobium aeschynomenes TaxID=2734909 RepID=UPI0015535D2C|nr:hypothetical protein [Bradyrhizobium aeschynomenes]NPU12037.1 hypothetical protein [Bradyrhizobium aeschynomenes]
MARVATATITTRGAFTVEETKAAELINPAAPNYASEMMLCPQRSGPSHWPMVWALALVIRSLGVASAANMPASLMARKTDDAAVDTQAGTPNT